MSSFTAQDVEAIVGGYHGDPFRVLGPHRTAQGWELRCFLPGMREASVVLLEGEFPMERVHEAGFFASILPHPASAYMIRAVPQGGEPVLLEDPYRFPALASDHDIHLFCEGTNYQSYRLFGARLMEVDGVRGVRFAVWAPHAEAVLVVGDFNRWDLRSHPMRKRDGGVWELFVPGVKAGSSYKYYVRSRFNGYRVLKADPFAAAAELPPQTASRVAGDCAYAWADADWMKRRAEKPILSSPLTIYELHAGSWLRGENNRFLSYRELAERLVPYVVEMNYTHIELLPILEHPFAGSWGYQVTGFFSPTSRYGSPDDFRYFVDRCHQAGLGVILDWVPGHFPRDQHGLHYFDGTFLFEHSDPRQGEHKEWGTLIFNYGRAEVQSFLLSSAHCWLEEFHLDGFRVDAVASMLYLDYLREPGEWLPNEFGGRENLEAISFLRRFNEICHRVPGVFTIAEESTSFPGVSHPTYVGGLGFTMKWNMGWMHDMFAYFKQDPIFRKGLQQNLTFSLMYAFSENFVLPISHDEVVHGKASLLAKMPGDEWQRFANVRCFLAFMYAHPGKKLLFMGQEIGQYDEWSEERSVSWDLLQFDYHRKLRESVRELNRLVRDEPALHEVDFHWKGFEWIDIRDVEASVISFLRRGRDPGELIVFVCNFTPVVREEYRLGVPEAGHYDRVLNTDAVAWGGSGVEPPATIDASVLPWHQRQQSILLRLPPLAVVAYKWRCPPQTPPEPKEKEAPLPVSNEELERLMLFEDDPELAYALT